MPGDRTQVLTPGEDARLGSAGADRPAAAPEAAAPPVEVRLAVDGREWDDYVSRHPQGTVDHLWAWRGVFERALGHRPLYFVARRAGAIVGLLPLVLVRSWVFGRSAVSLPFLNYGGVLADDGTVAESLVDVAREAALTFGASHVELRHMSRQHPQLPCRRHKLSMRMSLPSSSEELWSLLDRKVRNQVRKAQKANLECVAGGPELVDEFYAVFARNMRDLGTPVYPRALFAEAVVALSGRARVFIVRHDGRAVAAGVSIGANGTVLNPWASSLREARRLSANMLLYWRMLEEAVADGASVFDFGRSSPDGGTYQFKIQWGARAEPVCWEYVLLTRAEPPDQSPSNPKFEVAIAAWQRLPLAVANLIGPVLARHLP